MDQAIGQVVTGDIVYLKSGSPALTVVSWQGDSIRVNWFASGTAQQADFHRLCLVVTKPTEGSLA